MKAISLWQPWASLIVMGEKEYETRGWWTGYRGPLLIHAAKRKHITEMAELLDYGDEYANAMRVFAEIDFDDLKDSAKRIIKEMPFGKIIGRVDLVDCIKTDKIVAQISEKERDFGNYETGRYAWKLANPVAFTGSAAFDCKGEQGFFEVPLETWLDAVV